MGYLSVNRGKVCFDTVFFTISEWNELRGQYRTMKQKPKAIDTDFEATTHPYCSLNKQRYLFNASFNNSYRQGIVVNAY
jgi:hypothetical protein